MKSILRRAIYTATFLVVFFGLHACVVDPQEVPATNPTVMVASNVS